MMRLIISAILFLNAFAAAAAPISAKVAALQDAALKDELAWELTEGLTTEIGPRMAGTEAEERARNWAVAKLKSLGFSNVRVEHFDMPVWTRGEERAEVVSPFAQKLLVTALGNSASTPKDGISAEVVGFDSLEALKSAPETAVRGRIVFVNHNMQPTQDGAGYMTFGLIRRLAPEFAAAKGAAAVVIRSIGTDYHRNPHTGGSGPAVASLPSAALSLPDADQLARILSRGKPVQMKLVLSSMVTPGRSGNVIAEVPGSNPDAGIITIGGHLDSWDLGTGASDDAAGVAITTAAAKRIMDAGQPVRTIRLVWFGAEEAGSLGGAAYAKAHANEKHALLAEADTGASRVVQYKATVNESAAPALETMRLALARLGIVKGDREAIASDLMILASSGVPVIELRNDMTHYFDLHHTPDDTLDKINVEELRQCVAAWTTMLAILANDTADLGPVAAGEH